MDAVKKALILILVVLVVVTGIPVPAAGMSMECADCPPGVLFMAATCLAAVFSGMALVAAALMLAFGTAGRRRVGRGRAAPLLRPPRLA